MAEFPYFRFWTDAYLADTTHLTTIEHGAYMLLLVAAWRSPGCRLPNDDKILARYARMTPGQWRRIRDAVMSFWTLESGTYMQPRLMDEYEAVRQVSQSQSSKAKAKWRKYRNSLDAAASPGQCRSDAFHPPSSIRKKESPPMPPPRGAPSAEEFQLAACEPEVPKPKRKSSRSRKADPKNPIWPGEIRDLPKDGHLRVFPEPYQRVCAVFPMQRPYDSPTGCYANMRSAVMDDGVDPETIADAAEAWAPYVRSMERPIGLRRWLRERLFLEPVPSRQTNGHAVAAPPPGDLDPVEHRDWFRLDGLPFGKAAAMWRDAHMPNAERSEVIAAFTKVWEQQAKRVRAH